MSMEEFQSSPAPFRESYRAHEIMAGGTWYWMDNRYAITTTHSVNPKTGINEPVITLWDTDKVEKYMLRPGYILCYLNNAWAYAVGRYDDPDSKRYYGYVGRETEVPDHYYPNKARSKAVNYRSDIYFGCKNTRGYEEYQDIAREKFGVREDGLPKLDYVPLLPGHGFFSFGSERNIPVSSKTGAYWLKHIGLDWYSPKGDKKWLELALSYEVDKEVRPNYWSAFLARYVFNKNALFNRSPLGAHSLLDDFGVQYSLYIVTFSPLDGSVIKVHKPEVVLDKVSTTGIFATRAGFLWTGDIATPGLFLSQGEKLKHILDEHVHPRDVSISPDGCKVKVLAYPNRRATASGGSFRGVLGAVIAHSAPNPSGWDKNRDLLINVCTGE